ncbi:MAG: integral rane sensor signal transduction histidine kinase [Acidobacteriales bacterium]|nr:integral rane sensor signal transduction histidine kinase [Terriglobales bacterium]
MSKRAAGYIYASLLVSGTVASLLAFRSHANLTTVALAMVLVTMFCALLWRSGPALWASVAQVLCLNYFFIPPYRTFTIADPANWIAFSAFVITAIVVGQLSARAELRAEQAENRRLEIESLYDELKKATDEAEEAELLRRSEALKSALLDAVTHDLRTPLTSIKASVTTLLSETDDASLRELLEVINEESDRLNHFIQGMMDLARLESGNLRLTQSTTAIADIVESALLRAEVALSKHKVEVSLQEGLPNLNLDSHAISEVLYSLLENAAKYSPPGTFIRVTASLNGTSIKFEVEDQGPGIPSALHQKVFEKFFRAHGSSHARPGFGLGLSIAKGIVEAHSGSIWIEQGKDSTGTRIIFSLPVQSPPQYE